MRQPYPNELWHHGVSGQKWGVRHGPPYPLYEGKGNSNAVKESKAKYGSDKSSKANSKSKKSTSNSKDDKVDKQKVHYVRNNLKARLITNLNPWLAARIVANKQSETGKATTEEYLKVYGKLKIADNIDAANNRNRDEHHQSDQTYRLAVWNELNAAEKNKKKVR